jgi:hypothetical protein
VRSFRPPWGPGRPAPPSPGADPGAGRGGGAHDAVPGPAPRPTPQPRRLREWPIIAVLGALALSLTVVAANHFRRGTVLLALSVLFAAGLRAMLPAREAGLLAVRSRAADLVVLGGLGLGLLALALLVPPPST